MDLGSKKRKLDENGSSFNKPVLFDFNECNVGIEIETCCPDIAPNLKYFEKETDGSIRCEEDGQQAVEYILSFDERKYFKKRINIKNDMKTILNTCKKCGSNKRGQSTCGIHIHLSHPKLTKSDYPLFAKSFVRYWISTLYNRLKKKYSLRTNNSYCVENTCYYADKYEKYRQLNILPSEEGDLWHFEFRGMGDIHTLSVNLIDEFVEELAMEFTNAFQSKLNVDYIEELHETICVEEVPISDIIELLREANKAGKPIDLDSTYFEDDEETFLNQILFYAKYKVSDKDVIKEILDQAKKLDAYYFADDGNWYSPLYWIFSTDKKLGIELIPYFQKRGYKIGNEKKKFSEEFLKEWNALQSKLNVDYIKELHETIYRDNFEEVPISDIIELLREANKAGKPIDLDSTYFEDDEETFLNQILFYAKYKVSDKDVIKEILDQAKKLDAYYFADDGNWYSPLYWIFSTDKKLGIELIPYFQKRGYKIGNEKKKFSEEFLKEWNALEKKKNLNSGSNKRQKTQLYLTLSNLKF